MRDKKSRQEFYTEIFYAIKEEATLGQAKTVKEYNFFSWKVKGNAAPLTTRAYDMYEYDMYEY